MLNAYSGALGIDYNNRHFYVLHGQNGEVLHSSGGAPSIDLSPNIVTALGGDIGAAQSLDAEVFDCAVPFARGAYIIYIRDDKADMTALNRSIFRIVLQAAALGLIISLLLSLLLSKTMTVPIEKLTNSANRFTGGDFSTRLEIRSHDEIGTLTETFNKMASALHDSIEAVAGERDKLSTLFLHMTDGVAAFSLEGEVLHVNPAAKRLMGLGESDVFDYALFSEACALADACALQPPGVMERDLRVGDRDLRLVLAPYGATDSERGVVAVLHDNTEQNRLEVMRREFVSNVSHELRTPLTCIKSYAETLAEPDGLEAEDIARFSHVIVEEADRMTRLVRDLLTLSRFDYGKADWRLRPFRMTELLLHVYDLMRMAAKERGHTLRYAEMSVFPLVYGDRDRIEQVLVNIIANSISYTPEGGIIDLEADTIGDFIHVTVRDNGIGIPAADLPYVFDRFYRVDKARSRSLGGTGLGLAIAKEIAEGHGGRLDIRSETGSGTEIVLRLPISKGEQDKGEQAKGEQDKEEQGKEEQPKGKRSGEERGKDERSKGERSKGERSKAERGKEERSKEERSKGERAL